MVVGSLPIRLAIALRVMPLYKQSWISVRSSSVKCFLAVELLLVMRTPFARQQFSLFQCVILL